MTALEEAAAQIAASTDEAVARQIEWTAKGFVAYPERLLRVLRTEFKFAKFPTVREVRIAGLFMSRKQGKSWGYILDAKAVVKATEFPEFHAAWEAFNG